ncbi:Gastric triacylglycerol lipase [Paragonimus heterotremus]|uniref:Lipase n=1 Tax=Paragonimus heterotremus TaxID=100268 RepID=A0A8J4SMR9_9TREM|nr:Gastric triacylglycerol lipase [Paragonimus heterotremus]
MYCFIHVVFVVILCLRQSSQLTLEPWTLSTRSRSSVGLLEIDIEIYDFRLLHIDPEIKANASQIIRSYGYHVEEHFVTTDDGYILCLFRMRNPQFLDKNNLKVVYLQHGLLDSAHTWINNLRNESLAFILADAGFDVWLGNSRGSTYSRNHVSLTPEHFKFWEFSWDQMAQFDLPSSLYYVLNVTGAQKMGYVGHSQGCQIALAQFDRDPQLQSRISVFIAFAPVAFLGHLRSPIRFVAPLAQTLEEVLELFNKGEFLPSNNLMKFLAYFLCRSGHMPFVCTNLIYLIAGYDSANTNTTRLPVYVAHTPAGTSTQNIVHYCQSIMSNRFRQFDYGKKKNMQIYGQPTPPEYDLSNITVPTVVFSGGHDWLAVKKDTLRLIDRIEKAVISYTHFDHYNHLDFVWGMDTGYILYPAVLEWLSKY